MDIFMDAFLSNYILLFFLNISCLFWESYPMKYLHIIITRKNCFTLHKEHLFFYKIKKTAFHQQGERNAVFEIIAQPCQPMAWETAFCQPS